MVVNDRPLKRPKRNTPAADLPDFFSLPSSPPSPFRRPFRRSITDFLNAYARVTFPPSLFPSLLTWQIVFRLGRDDLLHDSDTSHLLLVLDIVEEDVTRTARSAYCNHCRVVGWSSHPVCSKRYHFIIRNSGSRQNQDENYKLCTKCNNQLDLLNSRCKWCDSVIAFDDVEDWIYSQLEDNSHMLHGVIHSNGFGHLLRVNGREGGSNTITGSQVMSFWNRICTFLSVRKMSVMDVSRKYGIEYRLLHTITKGHSWYGSWGYKFGRGSYGITKDAYIKAVETLSNVQLAPLLFQRRRPRSRLQAVVSFYQSLSESELVTLNELFSFLLRLIQERNSHCRVNTALNYSSSTTTVLCAWTKQDVESVQQAMMKVLRTVCDKGNWVLRHTLKCVLHERASPELLDYCLKHLGGIMAANNMVVQARFSPSSNDAEYRLAPLDTLHPGGVWNKFHPSKEDMKSDLMFLCELFTDPKSTLNHGPGSSSLIDAATKLLDCKHFVKDYESNQLIPNNSSSIFVSCHLELADQPIEDLVIPPELLVLPSDATVADLKTEATKAFQEVYAMCKRFEAVELIDYGALDDSISLSLLMGTRGSVKVRGVCPSKQALTQYGMERGTERWTVDCICGAKDDDGEKMLACDNCGVWQHTRCAGIDNSDTIPSIFVCNNCVKLYKKKGERIPSFKEEPFVNRASTCRGDAMKNVGINVAFSVP